MKTFSIAHIDELPQASEYIASLLDRYPVCLLSGEMGAGKTTLVKAVAEALGSPDTVSSPTFSVVNEYLYPGGSLYHFDLYRLKDENELWDAGFEEYLASGNVCLIEWPELAVRWLEGMEVLKVNLLQKNDMRMISIEITRI
jgi:tRNA threonylcarbamoyladenosine biosynthesis protein TsaE